MAGNYNWKFFRAGGFDQVKLASAADLGNLDQLDYKLWVALACPTHGLEFDSRTLELVDTDHDGRIRAPELIAAAKWTLSLLKNPDGLLRGSPSLALAEINDATPEGQQLLASAKQILINVGKADTATIDLDEAGGAEKTFAETHFNGDGIVPVDAAGDDATKAVIADIIECMGSETDRSGKPGIDQKKRDEFFAAAAAYSDWWKKSEEAPVILPLGAETAAAAATIQAIKAKVDDFFARCRIAAFDERAQSAMNRQESEYVVLAEGNLSGDSADLAAFPIAHVSPEEPLPLQDGVNPAWTHAVAQLQANVIQPLLGNRDVLTENDWNSLVARFAPFEAWKNDKEGAAVERLGLKRIREILLGNGWEAVTSLLAKDKSFEPQVQAIANVEKLVRFNRDIYTLCLNFVSFEHFYSRRIPAIFQAGRLYLDQRACDLCLAVDDAAKHSIMAALAGTYLAYCECVRKGSGEKMIIVAAFTEGDSDNLMVGRNGIFIDRKGRDWDATIIKLLDNPISIRQAFWLPYKKLVRMIEQQIAKRAAVADAASTAKLQDTALATANIDSAKPPEPKKMDLGSIALLTTAFTAIAGIITTILAKITGLFSLGIFVVPALLGVAAGLVLLISGPSMILAYMKLRNRNLGPILDANGWAVNARAKVNVPFGKSLTQIAALPPGSERDLVDPFTGRRNSRLTIFLLMVVLVAIAVYLWFHHI